MLTNALLIAAGVAGLAIGTWLWRGRREEARRRSLSQDFPAITDQGGPPVDDSMGMAPEAQGFVLAQAGQASVSSQSIPLRGRLQLYVAEGSQYAVWSQFPRAVCFEVQDPSGTVYEAISLERTVSEAPGPDGEGSHQSHARMPANQIMGETFEQDLFDQLRRMRDARGERLTLIPGTGTYRVRAIYQGSASNWVNLEVAP